MATPEFIPPRRPVPIGLLLVIAAIAFVIGALVTFGAGWGWNGAFNHAIVHMNKRDPGKASGLAMVGSALGCVLWPIAFGLIVTHRGYAAAWTATGGLVVMSAILLTFTMYKIRTRAAAALGSS